MYRISSKLLGSASGPSMAPHPPSHDLGGVGRPLGRTCRPAVERVHERVAVEHGGGADEGEPEAHAGTSGGPDRPAAVRARGRSANGTSRSKRPHRRRLRAVVEPARRARRRQLLPCFRRAKPGSRGLSVEGARVGGEGGFEPPVRLLPHLISSQAHSTRLWHLSAERAGRVAASARVVRPLGASAARASMRERWISAAAATTPPAMACRSTRVRSDARFEGCVAASESAPSADSSSGVA